MSLAMSISDDRRRQAFAQSITFTQFVETSTNYTHHFRDNYDATVLDGADRTILDGIEVPIDVLAIVEDWCPDVVANLPILARIADDTGKIRLHVLIRDNASRDIADAYPYEGRSHIPTYVFSDESGLELGVIVERTPVIREKVDVFIEEFCAAHPALDPATFPVDITDGQKAELIGESLQLRRDLRALERSSFVEALGALATHSPERLSAFIAN
jgi:hypothetical protein